MRKKLTVVQIICILISGLLTLWDKMFTWRVINFPSHEHYSTTYHDLCNLMTVQIKGLCPFLYWVFCIALVIMVGYCFAELFFEEKIKNNNIIAKVAIGVPTFAFLDGLIMVIVANSFNKSFTYHGQERHVNVSATVLAYVELALLVIIPLIEFYKQFKCVDQPQYVAPNFVNQKNTLSSAEELKKYKELLDMGAITQEEFEAKKEQLLNL